MEIQAKLMKLLKSTKANIVADVGIAAVSAADPLMGVILTAAHDIGDLADEFRINALIKGLSTGFNQEKQINQLYNYVEKSEKNAFYVTNTLRKALLSDSPIACTIMGRMLACHIEGGTVYTQEDNIIFHALENATDYDIRQFYKVMNEYKENDEAGDVVFHIPNEIFNNSDFASSLNWCVLNRIFNGISGAVWVKEGQAYDNSHSPTPAANRLFEYVDSVKQVLRYGEEM